MQTDIENKMESSAEENKQTLKSLRKQKKLLDDQLKSKEGREALPMKDGFGRPKPTTGHGALNRHERRKARKLAKKRGV